MRGNHWIVLSTLGCRPAEVNVYDSLYTSQDPGTLSAISGSLEVFRPPIIVNLMDIEKQQGVDDCGLFAAAVLTALARGIDPTEIKFDQKEMRPHLLHCMESQEMTPFPIHTSPRDTVANSIIMTLCL